MIPKRPTTAPAAHIHFGTRASWSSTFHTDSGTASAESMASIVCKVVDRSAIEGELVVLVLVLEEADAQQTCYLQDSRDSQDVDIG
jgi:hypothetical protein